MVIAATISISAILSLVYNQEIKLATGMVVIETQETSTVPEGHPIIAYNGTNCNPLETLNKTCFTDAFTNCIDARISKTETSIEGDPIITHAFVNSTNQDMCKIDVYRDRTKDRYGDQRIDHYVCSMIIESDGLIHVASCVPLEHGQDQRFEFE